MLSLGGSSEPLLATEFNERNPVLSPDGRWLAYESNVSGVVEVFVRPFPNVDDGRWQISTAGGTRPLWAPNGQELFYMAPDGTLMAAEVRTQPSFVRGIVEALFGGYYGGGFQGVSSARTHDISPDGKRFLMLKPVGDAGTEIVVVLNFLEELKRLSPPD